MEPENLKFGGGLTQTLLHPVVLVALIVAALLILLLPRKYVIVPLLSMSFLVPLGQQIVAGGVHVLVLRIVILIALIRISFSAFFWKSQHSSVGLSPVDKIFALWTVLHVTTFLLLFSFQSQAVVNQFGYVWDIAGGYLVLRLLIQDQDDIDLVIKTFAFISLILAAAMLNEHFRMQNVFGLLGGTLAMPETRDGLVRAQAAFAHPLLAGTFGATLLPLFILYWHRGKSRALAVVGVLSATIITICASSSTPLLAYVAGIGAVCLWPFRNQMRLFRWGIVFVLVLLQIVMKAPVWYVISHIQVMGASSSSHRAELVDSFIRHFSDWWLIGTNSNGSWGFDMWDTSNQYVGEGVGAGLATFLCFIGMISISFSRLGRARKVSEFQGNRAQEWYFWILGAALFAHVVAFFGISYFDQTRMAWFALLVMIIAATGPVLATENVAVPQAQGAPLPEAARVEPPSVPATPVAAAAATTPPWEVAAAKKSMLHQFKPGRS